MRNAIGIGLAAVWMAGMLGSAARADTLNFQEGVSPTTGYVSGATTIITDTNTATFGTSQNNGQPLFVGNTFTAANATTGAPASNRTYRSLFEFDLSALSGIRDTAIANNQSFTLNSVSLVLNIASTSTVVKTNLNQYGFDFDETKATYNNPTAGTSSGPDVAGGTNSGALLSSANNPTAAGSDVIFNSSANFVAAAQGALDNSTDRFLRFIATGQTATGGTLEGSNTTALARFVRDEDATLGNRPELIVDYTVTPVPEPTTMAMAALGLAGIAGSSRRRKRKERAPQLKAQAAL